MTDVRMRRVIVLEYTLSDKPAIGDTQYDDIDAYTDADIMREEKKTRLSVWAGNTEYTIISDDITAERSAGSAFPNCRHCGHPVFKFTGGRTYYRKITGSHECPDGPDGRHEPEAAK